MRLSGEQGASIYSNLRARSASMRTAILNDEIAEANADGASVRVLQNEAGRFDVVVDGSRGLITSFSNLSQESLDRLGARYGWE